MSANDNTSMPPDFLMQQIQWRESLEEADGMAALSQLAQTTRSEHDRRLAELADCLDIRGDVTQAAEQVRALMFIERFSQEIDDRIDQICA